jgi:hypothetical protein
MKATGEESAPKGSAKNWLREPSTGRPTYTCPACGELSLQFFHLLAESPQSAERNESFVCFACGRSWQV